MCASLATLLVSAPPFAQRAVLFAAHPPVPLESVARVAWRFNERAQRLGVLHATLLHPDRGGTLLLSNLRLVDIAGLCDRQFAHMYHEHRLPAVFARHILTEVKPDFVHIGGFWARASGLLETPVFAQTYLALGGGAYVRRGSLPPGLSENQMLAIDAGIERHSMPSFLMR